MRRITPAVMATLLALSATPALAQDAEEASAEPTDVTYEQFDAPGAGISLLFPRDWRVSHIEGTRQSAITSAEGEPIMETTAVMANAGSGIWCDVDTYLDMTGTLEEHAFAYTSYLQQVNDADTRMIVVESELPAGPAYRMEVFDPSRGRLLVMYLLDGPTTVDGTFDRYLLTCAARGDSDPFWEPIAESMELYAPITEEAASEAPVADEADAAA